jgi:hypothetical protein
MRFTTTEGTAVAVNDIGPRRQSGNPDYRPEGFFTRMGFDANVRCVLRRIYHKNKRAEAANGK